MQNTRMASQFLAIKRLLLDDFRCFESVSIDFSPNMTVFLAENGRGKSSIVESLAKVLSWLVSALLAKDGKGKGQQISRHDIRVAPRGKDSSDNCSVRACLTAGGAPFDIVLRAALPQSGHRVRNDVAAASEIATQLWKFDRKSESAGLPLFLFLSPGRTAVYRKEENATRRESFIKKLSMLGSYAAYDACLTGMPPAESFVGWLLAQLRTGCTLKGADSEVARSKLHTLEKVVSSFWNGFSGFEYRIESGQEKIILVVDDILLELDQISDGQRMVLFTFGEIAWRLIELNDGRTNSLHGQGIVLVDEIEMHLHPQWQQRIIGSLEQSFPGIQFVITTHSPQVVSTVSGKNIRSIASSDIQGKRYEVSPLAEQSQGLSSNDVLERIMNTGSYPRDIEQGRWVAECRTLILQRDFQRAEEILQKIKSHFGSGSVEFRLMQSMLSAYQSRGSRP